MRMAELEKMVGLVKKWIPLEYEPFFRTFFYTSNCTILLCTRVKLQRIEVSCIGSGSMKGSAIGFSLCCCTVLFIELDTLFRGMPSDDLMVSRNLIDKERQ